MTYFKSLVKEFASISIDLKAIDKRLSKLNLDQLQAVYDEICDLLDDYDEDEDETLTIYFKNKNHKGMRKVILDVLDTEDGKVLNLNKLFAKYEV